MGVAELAQDCVHAGLVAITLGFEPFQHIDVDAQRDLLLTRRHGQAAVRYRSRPVLRQRAGCGVCIGAACLAGIRNGRPYCCRKCLIKRRISPTSRQISNSVRGISWRPPRIGSPAPADQEPVSVGQEPGVGGLGDRS